MPLLALGGAGMGWRRAVDYSSQTPGFQQQNPGLVLSVLVGVETAPKATLWDYLVTKIHRRR